jgi:hypothetical protein
MHLSIPRGLRGAVVTARSLRMLWPTMGTSIQGSSTKKRKKEEGTHIPTIHLPYNDGSRRNRIKRAINTKRVGDSIHVLLDRRGSSKRARRKKRGSALFQPRRHGTTEVGRKRHDSEIRTNSGHHDCATKRHKAIPRVRSDAVVTARAEGTLWSRWR